MFPLHRPVNLTRMAVAAAVVVVVVVVVMVMVTVIRVHLAVLAFLASHVKATPFNVLLQKNSTA